MRKKSLRPLLIYFLLLGISMPAQSAIYNYSGIVVESTFAFASLVPVGTLLTGSMEFSDQAVQSGLAVEQDFLSLSILMGALCSVYIVDECKGTGPGVVIFPITEIDSIEVFFDSSTNVIGGEMDIAVSLPADPYIPWLFNFSSNTLTSELTGLGLLVADFTITPAVPVPPAIWFLGSACAWLFLGMCRRL